VDPISLLLMAQSAVSAIRAGCQMLSEGKAEIDKFKRTVEGGVKDARAIYGEVTGIWGWLTGLFGGGSKTKPAAPAQLEVQAETKPAQKKAKRQAEPELSYEEYQARSVHEICENLKIYFEAIRALKAHCRELEQTSLTTEKVADSAIDRIELEWQMTQLSTQVREAMTYTPERLGLQDLYKRFLQMYDQILEEQEFARQIKAKKERDTAWQLEHRKEILIYKLVYAVAVIMGLLEAMGLYFTL
jgi:hypothetical protein